MTSWRVVQTGKNGGRMSSVLRWHVSDKTKHFIIKKFACYPLVDQSTQVEQSRPKLQG